MTLEELSHYLRLGGVTLAMILLASVRRLCVAVERWIALWNISAALPGPDRRGGTAPAAGGHLGRPGNGGTVGLPPSPDVYRVAFERLERTRTVTPGVEAAVERERAQLGLRS